LLALLEGWVHLLLLSRAVGLMSSRLLLHGEVIVTREYGSHGVKDIFDVEGTSLWHVGLLSIEPLALFGH